MSIKLNSNLTEVIFLHIKPIYYFCHDSLSSRQVRPLAGRYLLAVLRHRPGTGDRCRCTGCSPHTPALPMQARNLNIFGHCHLPKFWEGAIYPLPPPLKTPACMRIRVKELYLSILNFIRSDPDRVIVTKKKHLIWKLQISKIGFQGTKLFSI